MMKDVSTYFATISCGIVAMAVVGIVEKTIFGHYDIGFAGNMVVGTSLLCFGRLIGHALFADITEYDKKIEEKEFGKEFLERVEQVKKEQAEKEVKNKQMEYVLEMVKASVRLPNTAIMNIVNEMVQSIRSILETETVSVEEEHYLTYTLPKDVAEMLRLYGELDAKRRKEKETEIFSFLVRVQEELQERFVERYQKETMQALDTRLVLSKQRMYERVE